jgi:transposase
MQNQVIPRDLCVSKPTVQLWRQRFLAFGLVGLEKDVPRPGRIPKITPKKIQIVVEATLHTTPPDATHWSTRSMARPQGLSEATIRRIWKQHNLKPHLVKTFKLSRDKRFVEKLYNEVGFYPNPPDKSLALCVDEKSQFQTRKHPRVKSWLKRHPRFHLHFIPTSSSWLNLTERWFRELTVNRIRRGTFQNVPALVAAIRDYIDNHNHHPQVFVWTAPVEKNLAKVAKCKEVSDALH